jgi:hypothetical protein
MGCDFFLLAFLFFFLPIASLYRKYVCTTALAATLRSFCTVLRRVAGELERGFDFS